MNFAKGVNVMKKWKERMPVLGVLGIWCMMPSCAMAAEASEAVADGSFLPPMVRDVMVVLQLVLALILLVAVAVLWTYLGFGKKGSRQGGTDASAERLERLENDMKAVTQELRSLRSSVAPASDGGVPMEMNLKEPSQEKKTQPWSEFIQDYNALAQSMEDAQADIACGNFAELQQLTLLQCRVQGNQLPAFSVVEDVKASGYWAWRLPKDETKFAVVPNPKVPYDARLHAEGGMKETFASNFQEKDTHAYRKIAVVLPAIFTVQNNSWTIAEPGLLRLEE